MKQVEFFLMGALLLLVWILVGLAVAVYMRRRGHDLAGWAVLGVVFGPFAIALAFHHVRDRETWARPVTVAEGRPASGPIDVLVGVDGSPQSQAAVAAACRLFRGNVGRFTLVRVLDFESALAVETPLGSEGVEIRRRAAEELEGLAAGVTSCLPDTMLLAGRPAEVLAAYAREHGYEVLVVGSRGRGRSKALLGSVASRLARGAGLPVLIVGEDTNTE